MKKLIEQFEAQEFTTREIILLCVTLFISGTLLGIFISPKGKRVIGSHNGNNNGNNNSGCLSENQNDVCECNEEESEEE